MSTVSRHPHTEDENVVLLGVAALLEKTNPLWRAAEANKWVASDYFRKNPLQRAASGKTAVAYPLATGDV